VTDDEYDALLHIVYEFCWHVAVGSAKSADLILHHESTLLKHCSNAKIKEGFA
jgi:hypothetical protein